MWVRVEPALLIRDLAMLYEHIGSLDPIPCMQCPAALQTCRRRSESRKRRSIITTVDRVAASYSNMASRTNDI